MTSMFNVVAEFDAGALTEARVDGFMEVLDDYHGTVGEVPGGGRIAIRFSLPADGFTSGARTAAAVAIIAAAAAGIDQRDLVRVDVLTEAEFNRRQGFTNVPDLVGVPEIAEGLGISQQAAREQIERGGWSTARRVGRTWVIASHELEQRLAARGDVATA